MVGVECAHCNTFVSSDLALSGVNNRNHCPYCLWSKHVDLCQSGDRLAACKAPMRPVGLTFKTSRNKYGSSLGELMIIHICTDCGRPSINRIAADDDSERLDHLFEQSLKLPTHQQWILKQAGIQWVRREDRQIIRARLFGLSAA